MDLHVVDLDDLSVGQTVTRTGNIVFCASKNSNAREILSHLQVALRVIIVFVGREDMGWIPLNSKRLHELHDLLRLSNVD